MRYFNYATGLTMTNARFARCSARRRGPRRPTLTQREMDIARSIQEVTEEVVLRLARTVHQELGPTTCAWPAVWRSTALPTAAAARGAVQGHLDTAGRR